MVKLPNVTYIVVYSMLVNSFCLHDAVVDVNATQIDWLQPQLRDVVTEFVFAWLYPTWRGIVLGSLKIDLGSWRIVVFTEIEQRLGGCVEGKSVQQLILPWYNRGYTTLSRGNSSRCITEVIPRNR